MRLAVSPDYPPSNSAIQNINHLQLAGVLDEQTVKLLNQLRMLRNRIVHGDLEQLSIPHADALQYADLAQQVTAKLAGLNR
jgi:hypothetical protein